MDWIDVQSSFSDELSMFIDYRAKIVGKRGE